MVDTRIVFYRLHIEQLPNYDIKASMGEFLSTIVPLDISPERRKQNEKPATKQELKDLLGLTGKLNFIGHGCLPVAAFGSSYLQQKISNLKVSTLREANKVLKEIQILKPEILFRSPVHCKDPA